MAQLVEKRKKSVKNNREKEKCTKKGGHPHAKGYEGLKKTPKKGEKKNPKECCRKRGMASSWTTCTLERVP